jgi:hypothetical protein
MPKASSKSCCEACKAGVCSAAQCACETDRRAAPEGGRAAGEEGARHGAHAEGPGERDAAPRGHRPPRAAQRAPTTSLRAGGIDPATLRASSGAAVVLDDARYTAHRRGAPRQARLRRGRGARGATSCEAPTTVVIGPGQAPRPSFEALREAHLDDLRWLLMGGACAGSTDSEEEGRRGHGIRKRDRCRRRAAGAVLDERSPRRHGGHLAVGAGR